MQKSILSDEQAGHSVYQSFYSGPDNGPKGYEMGDPITTLAVVIGAVIGTLSFEVGLNTLQNYYDTFYQDAFWEQAGKNQALDGQLKQEEKEIEEIFQRTNFSEK